jgi:predicted ATPase
VSKESPQRDDIDRGLETLNTMATETMISEAELARIINRNPKSIKRAIDRQELPPPGRWFGRNVWTVGSIRRHIEAAIDQGRQDVGSATQKVAKLANYQR